MVSLVVRVVHWFKSDALGVTTLRRSIKACDFFTGITHWDRLRGWKWIIKYAITLGVNLLRYPLVICYIAFENHHL